MYAIGALCGWGRDGFRSEGGNSLDAVCGDDFRALRRQVEALEEETRRGFAWREDLKVKKTKLHKMTMIQMVKM